MKCRGTRFYGLGIAASALLLAAFVHGDRAGRSQPPRSSWTRTGKTALFL